MAEKTVYLRAFPYTDDKGRERVALRGETVELTAEDVERGERLGAFVLDAGPTPAYEAVAEDLEDEDIEGGEPLNAFAPEPALVPTAPLVEPEPSPVAGPAVDVSTATDKPSGRDSREKWAAYAATKEAAEAELAPVDEGGLTRDQLREKYGA